MVNKMQLGVTGFKAAEDGSMKFSCYGNTKGNIDHAQDRTMDGAYVKSIERHKSSGTMPKMFWMHNPYETPVGKWVDMREDAKGLFMEGEFAPTEKGRELYELMKMGALDSFSIGYSVIEEKWNHEKSCNDLIELDIKEVSCVSFACNEESRLVGIKSKMEQDEIPTKRELEKFLAEAGLSRKQANVIASRYSDTVVTDDTVDILAEIAKL